MSTLTKHRIIERLQSSIRRLVVTPILSPQQIGAISVDVRLANQFLVFRVHQLGEYDPYEAPPEAIHRIQERQVVKYGAKFVLHPGMLALGATFEYVKLPEDLECQVEGRSSWARVGLQVATATSVEPGFKGSITLELSNVGRTPLILRPGQRIAQLVFRDALPGDIAAYGPEKKYQCAVGPEFSRLGRDEDGRAFIHCVS